VGHGEPQVFLPGSREFETGIVQGGHTEGYLLRHAIDPDFHAPAALDCCFLEQGNEDILDHRRLQGHEHILRSGVEIEGHVVEEAIMGDTGGKLADEEFVVLGGIEELLLAEGVAGT